jgi:hypothetical protein
MHRTILFALLATGLAGCVSDGKLINRNTLNDCPGDNTGISNTPILYGDSRLSAQGTTDIAKGSEWRLVLNPQGQGWDEATVTISPKPGNPAWISASGARSGNRFLKICVPETAEVGKTYHYIITVDGVGVLDPRARMIPR